MFTILRKFKFLRQICPKCAVLPIVVEIKSDGDVSEENKAKLKYGIQHFSYLNKELEKLNIDEKYHFHFLSSNSFDVFFDHLRNGKLIWYEFRSDLEDKLLAKNGLTEQS